MLCLESRESAKQVECCFWTDKLGLGGQNEEVFCDGEVANFAPQLFPVIRITQHHEDVV